jgi:hypothetical protein
MTVTFLVAVSDIDIATLTETALDIQDELERAGFNVESVKPWARPTAQASASPFAAIPNLVEPPAEPTPPTL